MRAQLKVTFDSNVIQRVLRPDHVQIQGAPSIVDQRIVHEALANGLVEGFVAKTCFTKEAIAKDLREDILRLTFRRYKPIPSVNAPNGVSLNQEQWRFNKHYENARKNTLPRDQTKASILSLMRLYHVRILHTFLCGDVLPRPTEWSGDCRTKEILPSDYYLCNKSSSDITERNDECFRYIQNALNAGVLSVDYMDSKDGKLSADQTKHNLNFKNPSAEESDMQAISTHYAHGIDVFCTEDMGKSAGKCSVMRPENKEALATHFGICFCTLHELAERVRQLSNSDE